MKKKLLSPTELKQLHAQQEEQKKILATQKLEEEKNKKLVSPKELLDPVEEPIPIVESVEVPEVPKDPIEVLRERIEELQYSIPEPKDYDEEIAYLETVLATKLNSSDLNLEPIQNRLYELKEEISNLPEVKYYDDEILALREQLNSIEVRYYDEEISNLQQEINAIEIPEVKYYDKDIRDIHERLDLIKLSEENTFQKHESILNELKTLTKELTTNLEQLYIPEEFDASELENHISTLQENVVEIKNELSSLPEVKYYENELTELSQMIENVRNSIPSIPEIKYYDTELQDLSSLIEEVRKSIPELPEVRYYENEISELEQKIVEVENKIPELPELPKVKYYDQEITQLEDNVVSIKKSISELKKLVDGIEIPEQTDWSSDIQSIYKEIEKLKEVPVQVIEESKDPLVPLDQKFATLDDLQEHYRLFINRVQQQLTSLGGGGETRLEFLDDVDRSSAKTDGYVLSYQASTGKFIGTVMSGGGGSGISTYADVAGIATYATSSGIATYSTSSGISSYASTAGIATYSSTSGIATYASTAGISSNSNKLDNQLPSYYLDYTNFTNTPVNLSQFTNNVGFITSSALVGYATETYVNVAIASLVNSAPATLDTLKELADALGDDPNFSVTITNSLANKLSLSGGVVSGIITASGFVGDLTGTATYASNAGVATYASTAGVSTYSAVSGIATYASTSGIATVSQGLTGTPSINVGLTTANRLIVGAGTTFPEDLVVEGNARVTGILTIGTASVTIDGDNNTISAGDVFITGSSITLGDNVTLNAGATGINSAPNVLYVAKDGSDDNNGTSIDNAKLTIAGAVAIAQSGTTIKVLSGTYNENNPIEVPAFVSIVGDSLKTVTIIPNNSTQDLFHLNKGTYLSHMTFTGHTSPAAAVAFPPTIATNVGGGLWESPYVQNCTSNTTTGTGMRIDGNLAEGLKSMVVDSYTQYNQGGVGIAITNGGYAQLVSVFTICCNEGITAYKGGQCSLTNSNTDFGTYGLVADGVSDLQFTGTASTSNAGTATVTLGITTSVRPYEGQIAYFGTLYYTIQSISVTNGGSGYTSTPTVSISAPSGPNGVTATAFATLDGDKVSEITIINSGNQYTEAPSVTISAPDSGTTATAEANINPIYYTINSSTPIVAGITTVTLEENLINTVSSGTTAYFYQVSRITASSHTFEYVGAGNDIATATPLRGGVPIQENEIVERNGGRVVYTSTDQSGNFRIGNDIVINQNNGTISGRAFTRSLFNQMTPFILALS